MVGICLLCKNLNKGREIIGDRRLNMVVTMNNKTIILFSTLIIGFIMLSLPYMQNDMKASSDLEDFIHSVDSDGDHLPDNIEIEYGTNPYEVDSDFDLIGDMDEIYLGTDPIAWDTDNDNMADGHELGISQGSTSPFESDSDHDGLPDPWEDNDGDQILNREEQLSIHDGVTFYVNIFGALFGDDALSTTIDPNEADTDGDGWDDGYEIQVNSTHTGGSSTPTVDRKNSDLDIANTGSYAYWFTSTYFGWDTATFADWRNGLKLAGSYGLLPAQCTNIAWYHFSPYWIYEQLYLDSPSPPNFNTWRTDYFHGNTFNNQWGTTNETFWGDLDHGSPYEWNNYDCDPSLNDTDGDFMDDNWDVYPLRYNTRNGTFAAVTGIRRVGESFILPQPPFNNASMIPPGPDQWNYFGKDISVLELEKGDWVDINITLGLQHCDPSNGTHTNYINDYWDPISVFIQFRTVDFGTDNLPHTVDDEVDINNTGFMTRRFTNVDPQHIVEDMREKIFTNHMGENVTITFYYQHFRIRIPSRVPAGQVALVVETQSDNNFHYFPSDEWNAY
jgi:hypothetical protein